VNHNSNSYTAGSSKIAIAIAKAPSNDTLLKSYTAEPESLVNQTSSKPHFIVEFEKNLI
jgi:hypothetical protein